MTVLCALATFMSGCHKESTEELQFSLGSANAEFNPENNTIIAGPERQTISIRVNTESSTDSWMARCPTDDVWCSFSKKGNELIVTLDANNTDDERATHITIELGSNSERIEVRQDYLRYLSFNMEDNTTTVGAAAAVLSLPYTSNIKTPITAKVAAGVDWITDIAAADGILTFTVRKNNSITDDRNAVITVTGDDVETSLTIIQRALEGYNYRIDLSNLDFADSYVYEIWDETNNIKVGELCSEYLYKVVENTSEVVVQMKATVAYPYLGKQSALDLQNGYVLETGGKVMWNASATDGYSVLSSYMAGSLTSAPSVIYMPAGASIMTDSFTPEADDEVFDAVLKPLIVTDTRTGAANSAGETTETWTYKIVKIGTQYWMAENLKTSRYRSGENIPTNIANADWVVASGQTSHPGCLTASASGASSRNIDANAAAAKDMRNEYGCLYNYPAIVGRDIEAGNSGSSFSDVLSPEGWGVPTRDEFMLMVNYVLQGATNAAQSSLEELSATASGTWANVTGFSAKGNASRGVGTGGFNSGLYYITMDYVSSDTTPSFRYVRVNASGNNVQGTHNVGVGDYIRCLRK